MPLHTGLQNILGLTQQQPNFASLLQQANPNAQFTQGTFGNQQDPFGGLGLQLGAGQDLAVGTPTVTNDPMGLLAFFDQLLDSEVGKIGLDFGQASLAAALQGQQKGLPQPVGESGFQIPQGFSPQQALLQVLRLT